ncbi:magnesium transporter CorA family protein [Lacticaseibacillus hegangensis]|uniref:Magnesium transporter CorA family protein n=1 Tax=Lacticaseibacillus hegangensis TaxID=2486010 RepID=A0ABW4CTC3_9LACO|nr:magnesium transporter CorA family protein [Lacticaseibacillus hegangensis]
MQKDYAIKQSQTTSATETSGACWHCIFDPSEAELQALKTRYDLPDGYVEAALDDHEDARGEALREGADAPGFILVREPYAYQGDTGYRTYETMPIALILLADELVTISRDKPRLMDAYLQALDQVETADSLALRIVDRVLECYTKDIDDMAESTHKMEKQVKNSAKNTLIYEVMSLEKGLVYFNAALTRTKTLVADIRDSDRYFLAASDARVLFLLDVKVRQILTTVASTEEILDQYNSAISSVVGNNLNLIMKMLTSVSILLAIPPIISGIFGQNTWIPWKGQPVYGFWLTLALAAGISGAVAWWLHRKDYF